MLFGGLTLAQLIANAIALLVAIDVHEFCHGWMANRLGDPTPRYHGRLTLNPLAHLDPLGTLMLLLARFGWGKPVPVNPYNLGNPKRGLALVSFAGPLANLLAAAAFALPIRWGLITPTLGGRVIPSLELVLTTIVLVNVGLALFNLIPIAPLDGFQVAVGLLPHRWSYALARLERYGPLLLLLLIVAPTFLGIDLLWSIMGPLVGFIWMAFTGHLF